MQGQGNTSHAFPCLRYTSGEGGRAEIKKTEKQIVAADDLFVAGRRPQMNECMGNTVLGISGKSVCMKEEKYAGSCGELIWDQSLPL